MKQAVSMSLSYENFTVKTSEEGRDRLQRKVILLITFVDAMSDKSMPFGRYYFST
jgi:hypothetical protein